MSTQPLLDPESQCKAFMVLFERCLQLASNDELVTVFDESFAPFHPAFSEAVMRSRISTTQICWPDAEQRHFAAGAPGGAALPSGVQAAISASTALITLLSDSHATTPARRAIIHHPRPGSCRFAHIPGLSHQLLAVLLRSPVEEVLENCELLAWALGEADDVELETCDEDNNTCTLRFKLDNWDNEPLMSPGVIFPGSWGNVPPGETFCCPSVEHVNGTVCVNGSIPGHVFDRDDHVLLTFRSGKLVAWQAPPESAAARFFAREEQDAKRRGDADWNTVAELGIGANPAITELTGSALFDEKALGTVHLAIGDNFGFGHNVKSQAHHDLVMRRPTLRSGGLRLISRGCVDFEGIHAAQKHATPTSTPLRSRITLRRARVCVGNGIVYRRLHTGARVGYVQIAMGDIGSALAQCADALSAYGEVVTDEFLRRHRDFAGQATTDLLQVLLHYRIVHTYDLV